MKQMIAAAVIVAAFSASAFAAGPVGRHVKGNSAAGMGASSTVVRPVDSQRRDGTFLNTGVTANGSTVRPANGKGVMDGTGPLK